MPYVLREGICTRPLIHSIVFKITLMSSSLFKYGYIQCTCTHLAKYNFEANLEYNIPQGSAVQCSVSVHTLVPSCCTDDYRA